MEVSDYPKLSVATESDFNREDIVYYDHIYMMRSEMMSRLGGRVTLSLVRDNSDFIDESFFLNTKGVYDGH